MRGDIAWPDKASKKIMAKSPNATGDIKFIRDLAELLSDTNLSEVEVEKEGLRVRVARQLSAAPLVHAAPIVQHVAAPVTSAAPQESAPAAAAPAAAPNHANAVKSPMVGTVYVSPEPGADPFVKVGDKVKEGQTILIVEAMKVMNPISAPRAGTVKSILVSDSDPIEFDQPLMIIE